MYAGHRRSLRYVLNGLGPRRLPFDPAGTMGEATLLTSAEMIQRSMLMLLNIYSIFLCE